MFWDQKIETLDRPALEQLQLQRLQKTVRRVAAHVPFYREKFAELGVRPRDIHSLDDLRRLPFTTSADLRANYPTGLLAVPLDDALRLHTSSGTTGKPKALFFSRQDVDNAAELCARSFVMTGVTKKDVFQNMMTYGMFTGALVTHYGAEKVGCLVIPAGPGNSERQLMLMQDFRTTFIHLTPSYALYLATFLEKHGVDPRRDLALRKAFVGAEPYTEETRRKIEAGPWPRRLQFLRPFGNERPRRRVRVRAKARHASVGGPFPHRDHQPGRPANRCPTANPANW